LITKRDFHLQIGILGYRISPLIYKTGVSAYKRDSQATFHLIEEMFQDIITNGTDVKTAAKAAEDKLNSLMEAATQ